MNNNNKKESDAICASFYWGLNNCYNKFYRQTDVAAINR